MTAAPQNARARRLLVPLFCLDAALSGSWGHWDVRGRAPYLRWGLAGGVDYQAATFSAW